MKKQLLGHPNLPFLFAILVFAMPIAAEEHDLLQAARTIIEAVNEGDAEKYALVFTEDAVVQRYGESPLLRGRRAILENRRLHFENFSNLRAEIVHLARIGQRVVMHDRVWLGAEEDPIEVVEIFEFEEGLVVQMEVIQAAEVAGQNEG